MCEDEPTDDEERVDWLLEQGRVDEAVALLDAITDRGRLGDLTWLTDVLAEHGRFDEAVAEWHRAIAAGLAGARGRYADMLDRAGRTDEAVAAWRAAVAAGDPGARVGLSRHLARVGRLTEAESLFRELLAGGVPAVAPDLVMLLADSGRTDEAVALGRALRQVPGVPRWEVGQAFEKRGLVDEAIESYRTGLAEGASHLYARLAQLLYRQRRVDEAIAVLRAATEDRDMRYQAWRKLGYLLGVEGRAAELNAEARRCAGQLDGWFVPFLVAASKRGWHEGGFCGCADAPS
ncbi:hypothetical protein GA0074695_5534 [Micromonospora viridifaciens]|uniref:Tetratricopeptide repeat-containing protein n=1 Tax=Micromonospora viridifaciens TaxID=1881 RepID=A0A1C4ZG72_MICVI|nr:tetratricopeptide repeat protein [Micromonospora viridifaciens]SCF31928.1 hypothetical protein GA0074695_5534 [Micromonospora viridifaciens]